MKIFKSYGFWTAFAGAVVILINALGELFGFAIESKLVENVIMAVAGVLVALGVVSINGKQTEQNVDQNAEELTAGQENVQTAEEEQQNDKEN